MGLSHSQADTTLDLRNELDAHSHRIGGMDRYLGPDRPHHCLVQDIGDHGSVHVSC